MRNKLAEDRLNGYEMKMREADVVGNESKWKRYRHLKRGYKRALRDLGYKIGWDELEDSYTVTKEIEII